MARKKEEKYATRNQNQSPSFNIEDIFICWRMFERIEDGGQTLKAKTNIFLQHSNPCNDSETHDIETFKKARPFMHDDANATF